MVLRPLFIARLGHTTLGGPLVLVGVGVRSSFKGPGGVALAALAFVGFACIAARSFFMRVGLSDETVEVSGLLWSRTIPASAVTTVTDFPAIRWRDGRDRRRWTPIIGLMSNGRQLKFVTHHNLEQVRQLQKWAKRHYR